MLENQGIHMVHTKPLENKGFPDNICAENGLIWSYCVQSGHTDNMYYDTTYLTFALPNNSHIIISPILIISIFFNVERLDLSKSCFK